MYRRTMVTFSEIIKQMGSLLSYTPLAISCYNSKPHERVVTSSVTSIDFSWLVLILLLSIVLCVLLFS